MLVELVMVTLSWFMLIMYSTKKYCVFSHDVMAAIFVSQNNETVAMFVSQTIPVGLKPTRFLLFQ